MTGIEECTRNDTDALSMTGIEECTRNDTDGLSMTGNAAGRSHLQSLVRSGVCGGNNIAHGFGRPVLLCAGGVGGRDAW
jgi:predicted TIM-barrel enzyme